MYDDPNTKYHRHANFVKDWIEERNVLDIGAGDGKITHLLNITGVDDDAEGVRLAKERGANVVLGDAYSLPFGDESFTSAFLGDTLEHMEFPEKVIREARRVVTTFLYIANPIKGMDSDPFHYQEWTPEELIELVEARGFKLVGEVLTVKRDKRDYIKFLKV